MEADLKHYGKYVDGTSSIDKEKLRAMSGNTSTMNAGFQVEFYPLKTDDYYRGGRISPYVSLGCLASLYNSEVKTSFGNGKIGNPSNTLTKYLDGYRNDVNQFTASISGSVGTRYKLSDYHSLLAEVKLQYYFSDWVDGLNPNSKIYTENRTNDYLGSFNIGYIYYLDQN
jgi:hypothetical protein